MSTDADTDDDFLNLPIGLTPATSHSSDSKLPSFTFIWTPASLVCLQKSKKALVLRGRFLQPQVPAVRAVVALALLPTEPGHGGSSYLHPDPPDPGCGSL